MHTQSHTCSWGCRLHTILTRTRWANAIWAETGNQLWGAPFVYAILLQPPKQSNVKELAACQKYQSIPTGEGVATPPHRGGLCMARGEGGQSDAQYFISNVFFSSRCFYLFSMRFPASLRGGGREGHNAWGWWWSTQRDLHVFGTTFDVLCKQSRR